MAINPQIHQHQPHHTVYIFLTLLQYLARLADIIYHQTKPFEFYIISLSLSQLCARSGANSWVFMPIWCYGGAVGFEWSWFSVVEESWRMVTAKPIGADLEQTRGFWCQSGAVGELWVLSRVDLVLWKSRGFWLWVLNGFDCGFWLGLILGFDCVGIVVVGVVLLPKEPWVLGWLLVAVSENAMGEWLIGWFLVAGGAVQWVRICGLPWVVNGGGGGLFMWWELGKLWGERK